MVLRRKQLLQRPQRPRDVATRTGELILIRLSEAKSVTSTIHSSLFLERTFSSKLTYLLLSEAPIFAKYTMLMSRTVVHSGKFLAH